MTVGALLGLLLGAVAGGFGTLLLAQRAERRAADSGQRHVLNALRYARRLYRQHLDRDISSWWAAEDAPVVEDWDARHQALVGELSDRALELVEQAVGTVTDINAMAAAAETDHADNLAAYEHAVELAETAALTRGEPNPACAVARDGKVQAELNTLKPIPSLTDEDRPVIKMAVDVLDEAIKELEDAERGVLARNARMLRTGTIALALFALVAVLAVWTPWSAPPVKASAVAGALRVALRAEAVDCDATAGRAGAWTCTAEIGAQNACPASKVPVALVSPTAVPGLARSTCGGVRDEMQFTASSASNNRKKVFARLIAETARLVAEQTGKQAAAGALQPNGLVRVPSDIASNTTAPSALVLQVD